MRSGRESMRRAHWGAAAALALIAACPLPADAGKEMWISAERLSSLPMSGGAWETLLAEAYRPLTLPDLSDQDDKNDTRALAKALVYARTGEEVYRAEVVNACMAAMGTEGGETLALGRSLVAYVIAADLVGLPPTQDAAFRSWLRTVRTKTIGGRTLVSTHEDRPNNWGTHAGASRIAIAIYLGESSELESAANVFRGFLGDRDAYTGFSYGSTSWQADPSKPVGINPAGATKSGRSIDGVLPDDQRRGGSFTWPPPRENYVYEALQGALAQAILLDRAGYDVWEWSDRALLRAFRWLNDQASFPAEGDDSWQPHVINYFYETSFIARVPSKHGKNVGFTDWTHAGSSPGGGGGTGGGGGGEASAACPVEPADAGCREHRDAQLRIGRRAGGAVTVRWRWTEGLQPTGSAWGDPEIATDFAVCAYDTAAQSAAVGLDLGLAAGAGWSARNQRRKRYRARSESLEGAMSLDLRSGAPGQAKIRFKARARALGLTTLASTSRMFRQDPAVTILTINDRGDCWSSKFDESDTVKNVTSAFRARSRRNSG